jgi:aspartate racemase
MLERDPAVLACNLDGHLPPVVFFHTWVTEPRHLRDLAEFLGPDQPLYGIEPPADEGPMPRNIDDWVAFHRRAFDALDVEPPYFLAGFSFGGVVALEIARQLRAEGSAIAWLGLVDAIRPKLNPKGLRPYTRYHWGELQELPDWSRRRTYVRQMWKGGKHRTRVRLKVMTYNALARAHIVEARSTTFADVERMTTLKRAVARSYLRYQSVPYDAPATLFVTQASTDMALGDRTLRWSRFLTGGLELKPIEGRHMNLFSPEHIHSVGGAIRDSLARVRESGELVQMPAGSRGTHELQPLRREGTSGR